MKYSNTILTGLCLLSIISTGVCQQQVHHQESDSTGKINNQLYVNTDFHQVIPLKPQDHTNIDGEVKNIILMIGDGMGLAQVHAGAVANKGMLNILNFPVTGFAVTRSSDNDITDSASGATAMASGVKTYNGAIGVDSTGTAVPTILELAELGGMATGLVATCRITHATPASFISHRPSRHMYEGIAMDFLNTEIDVFIGGGKNNFAKRRDGTNLLDSLIARNYTIITDPDSLTFVEIGKLAGLIDEQDQKRYSKGRGNMLENATLTALKLLKDDPDGFFLMIEGSQIDWGGHDNDTGYIIEEVLDFDRSVGIVTKFALDNPGTLVIITADHETGGFSIIDSDQANGKVEGAFTTGDHTGIVVPVFALGSQAYRFTGTYDNTEIFFRMKEALGL